MTTHGIRRRGFASMSEEKQREIASKGGKAAHLKGTAHQWSSNEAREAGRRGGQKTQEKRRQHRTDENSTNKTYTYREDSYLPNAA